MATIANGRGTSSKKRSRTLELLSEETAKMENGEIKKNSFIIEGNEISIEELKGLFGNGFTKDPNYPENYKSMYKKYLALSNNYPIRTEMHQEALVTYVKYAYKRDKAIEEDDIDAADKWGKLCAKQATDAKINPNQLSAADLSEGISNFSKLVEAIEKAQDVIPILPKYRQSPLDMVDYTLWQYINYIRRLQNLPTVKYSQIYDFLQERYDEDKKNLKFLTKPTDGKYDENSEEI